MIHSFLHVNGYDHKKETDFLKMKNVEEKILMQFDIKSPYFSGLVCSPAKKSLMKDGSNKEIDLSGENLKSSAFFKFKSIFIIGADAYKAAGVKTKVVSEALEIPALSNC